MAANRIEIRIDTLGAPEAVRAFEQVRAGIGGIKAVANPFAGLEQDAAALRGALGTLGTSLTTGSEALGRLAASADSAGTRMGTAAQGARTLSAGVADASTKAQAAATQVETLAQRMDRVGGQMQTAGGNLTAGLTVPLAALGIGAGKAAIDYEQAMAGVAKTTGGTAAEVAAMGAQFKVMSERIPISAVEIAKVAASAGQLGIAKENVTSFTETMAALGSSTNLTADAAATALAKIANITQMSAADFGRLGSTLVALGNVGASTEAQITDMALRIAGAGQQLGLTQPQILGIANALSSLGLDAEAGGSAVSKIMSDMALTVATNAKELKLFAQVSGQSVAEFKRSFGQDAAGTLIRFVEGIGNLKAAGQSVYPVLEKLGIVDIRMRDTLLRAAGAGDLFRQSIQLGSKAWEENTALTASAARFYGTTGAQMAIMRNRIVNVAEELGTTFVPAIVAGIDAVESMLSPLRGVVRLFGELPEPVRKTVLAIGGIAAMAGPATYAIGALAQAYGTLAKAVLASSIIQGTRAWIALVPAITSTADAATLATFAVQGLLSPLKALAFLVSPEALLVVGIGAVIYKLYDLATASEQSAARMRAALTQFRAAAQEMGETELRVERSVATEAASRAQTQLDALVKQRDQLRANPDPQMTGLLRGIEQQISLKTIEVSTYAARLGDIAARQARTNAGIVAIARGFGVGTPPKTPPPPPIIDLTGDGKGKKTTPDQRGLPGTSFGDLTGDNGLLGAVSDSTVKLTDQLATARRELALAGEALASLPAGSTAFKGANEEVFRMRQNVEELTRKLAAAEAQLASLARTRLGVRIEDGRLTGGPVPDLTLAGRRGPGATLSQPFTADQRAQLAFGQSTREQQALIAMRVPLREMTQAQRAMMRGNIEYIRAMSLGGGEMSRAAQVAVGAFSEMATAALSGTRITAQSVISMLTSIASALPGVTGLGAAVIGAVGGIIGGIFGRSERKEVQPVRLEEYSQRALDQQTRKEGPDVVVLQIIDPNTGRTVAEQEYQLRRRERRDAVSRIPAGVALGRP